jgi:hypothetical protein
MEVSEASFVRPEAGFAYYYNLAHMPPLPQFEQPGQSVNKQLQPQTPHLLTGNVKISLLSSGSLTERKDGFGERTTRVYSDGTHQLSIWK